MIFNGLVVHHLEFGLLLLYNLTLSNHYRFLVQTIFSARKYHGSALSSAAHFWVLKLLRRPVTTNKTVMRSHHDYRGGLPVVIKLF